MISHLRNRKTFLYLAMFIFFSLLFCTVVNALETRDKQKRFQKPQRIVSTNVCIDNLLLGIFGTDEVIAVSKLIDNPNYSLNQVLSAHIKRVNFNAEQILPLHPTIILVSAYASQRTRKILEKSDAKIIVIPFATNLIDIQSNIKVIGAAIDRNSTADEAIQAISNYIHQITTKSNKLAIHLTPNNYIYGSNSLIGNLILRSGLDNVSRNGLGAKPGFYSLERLVSAEPDIFILDDVQQQIFGLNHQKSYHPVIKKMLHQKKQIVIDQKLWSCGHMLSPIVIDILKQRTLINEDS